MKTKAQKQVEHWVSMFNQYAAETGGFSAELSTLEDCELINLKRVTPPFLELAPRMLETVKAKHRAELRRAIAYLTDLAERQNAAWPKALEKHTTRQSELKEAYLQAENPELTESEKVTLIKNHFGWE